MRNEIVSLLRPTKGKVYIDGTVGGGGHAEALMKAVQGEATFLGIDADSEAIARSRATLRRYEGNVHLVHGSYIDIVSLATAAECVPAHGILIDLGLSSDQLKGGRGFSFQTDSPLDMRFGFPRTGTQNAKDIIMRAPVEELMRIFREYGEEPHAVSIARAIEHARHDGPIATTRTLADVIMHALPPRLKAAPEPVLARIFQSLRIAVNGELENLKAFLPEAMSILEPGGRLAVISYHSLEDRIVKDFFRRESKECICPPEIPVCRCGHTPSLTLITPRPLEPDAEEKARNPRSRSAKLRVAERIISRRV